MKIICSILILSFYGLCHAQIVNIPDVNFKNFLLSGYDSNNDNEIQFSEANSVNGLMYIAGLGISNMNGIEAFTNIDELYCHNNQITSLDLSANTDLTLVWCRNNQITNLNVAGISTLTDLDCSMNQLTTLNVSNNPSLEDLNCAVNLLTSINVSSNPALISLKCGSNQLSSINVSGNSLLEYLNCSYNQITNLILPYASNVFRYLDCYHNLLTNINVAPYFNLEDLNCYENQLTNLNVSNNTMLYSLSCENNQLTSLNLSSNHSLVWLDCSFNLLNSLVFPSTISLTNAYCQNNQLVTLSVPPNNNLHSLDCNHNNMTNINVSGNTALGYLDCSDNQLTILNIFGDTNLSNLLCHHNQLADLNLTSNINLTNLDCKNNQLASLDITANVDLLQIYCENNQLTSLNVSSNIALYWLSCINNQLTNLNVQNGSNIGMGLCTLNNPNLFCIQVDDSAYSADNWTSCTDAWSEFNLNCGTDIVGRIKDVDLNFSTGNLDFANCEGCIVELYQGSSLLDTQTTTVSGAFNFIGLGGSDYKIIAKKTIGSTTAQVTRLNVDPGDVLTDLKIPCSLVILTNKIIDSLESRIFTSSLFYNFTNVDINTTGYDEILIRNYTNNCLNIQTSNENVVNSLSRLYLAQNALKEFNNDGSIMISETVVSAYDFGIALYSIATVNKKIDDISSGYFRLIKKLKKYTLTLALKSIKYVAIQTWNYIDDNNIRTEAKEQFEGIMEVLIDKAESKNPNDFNQTVAASYVRDYITIEATPFLYSYVFVPLTKSNVETAHLNAVNNNYSGTFNNSFSTSNALINNGHQKTILATNKIDNLRTISTVSGSASELAGIAAIATSIFDGGTMLTISKVLSGISIASTGLALGTGLSRLNQIKNELPNTTFNSFHAPMMQKEPYSPQHFTAKSIYLSSSITNYNNQLSSIQSNIINNQRNQAIAKIDSLIYYDSILMDAQINSLAPIYAAAPYATSTITNFDSLYNYSVLNSASQSIYQRQAINYNLIAYLLDSINTSIIDSFNVNVANILDVNYQMGLDFDNMNDSIINISVPAHIFVTSQNVPKPMYYSSEYPVSFAYQNIGTMDAQDVYAKLELKDGFTTSHDSIFIGSVIAGGTGNVTFTIQSPNIDTMSYLTVVFYSPNTTSDGTGASLVVNSTLSVSNLSANSAHSISIYPNPFKSEITVEFDEYQKNTTINILDALGKKIKSLNLNGNKIIIDKSGMNSGIYFLQIVDENEYVVSRKIVLQ